MTDKKDIRNDKNIGLITISRSYGGSDSRFVGSTVPSDTAITIKIQQAEKSSNQFQKETFYGKQNIVEVEMTPNQWAELITTLNYSTGTPCTITQLNNEIVEQTYQTESVFEYYDNKIQNDFAQASRDFSNLFSDALDVLDNKKTITKTDRETIKSAYHQMFRFLGDQAPFVQKLFKEDLERHTIDAANAFKNDMNAIIQTLKKEQLEHIDNVDDVLKLTNTKGKE